MRLSKPWSRRLPDEDLKQKSTSHKLLKLLGALIAVGVLVFIIGILKHKEEPKKLDRHIADASALAVKSLKDSKDINDQRSLASAYIATGDYTRAEAIAKAVADQTNEVSDYLSLLNICVYRNVPDKETCLSYSASKLKPQINKLSFYDVYSTAVAYDDAHDSKNAVIFYQRAYDIYKLSSGDQYTKTKAQIKQRIDELSK